ncbi:hypothetical protein [Pelosinus propionicus]|uniref:Uncharacterized protein n=1 Tax=Pelosinus propionicus DSM 13327 TaxID=1123291 RepID=A0A1I4NFJ8_9FIRM|nr:hypothetical protein [Pelosinus propionicus]SFM14271.1 hypothetical protein SAMN04490355_10461 [Pelosinus propionicus DSM 13327]
MSEQKEILQKQLQLLSERSEHCLDGDRKLSTADKIFQLELSVDETKTKNAFCKFFLQDVSRLSVEELSEYLSEIFLIKNDGSINVFFKFKKDASNCL